MKLSLKRETLLSPLQAVMGVVEKKQTLPILANVLIRAEGDTLTVTATDLEVELIGKTALENPIKEVVCFTVPGRKLIDICKALPDGAEVNMTAENNKVVVRSGRSRFTLLALPADDFPSVDERESHLSFDISAGVLARIMSQTQSAMAQQDVRYYLNGMLFEASNGSLRTVATDGHRLSTCIIDLPLKVEHRVQVIVPRKGVIELTRLLHDTDGEVSVTLGTNHVQVHAEHYSFTSKLIEGRFPDYQRVIPKGGDKTAVINRDVLKQALSRAAILCNEKFKGVRLTLNDGLLSIEANNPEQEAAEEELSVQFEGETVEIGFNVSYLFDVLNTVAPGEVRMNLKDGDSSVLIEHVEDNTTLFVIMPMRL